MAGKLYTHPALAATQKVLITSQYAGVSLEVITDAEPKVLKGLAPGGKVPVLVTGKGTVFESSAIQRYLARLRPEAALFGEKLFDSALVDSWLDFCTNEIEVPAAALIYPVLGWMAPNPAMPGKASADLKKSVMILEQHLKKKTYLVGRAVTIADISVACALLLPMKLAFDEKMRKAFPCVVRWFTTLVAQPEFQAVVGKVCLCKKALTAPKGAAPAKKGGKKDAPKKEKKKKKEAAPPAPKPAKKPKNPLELLPKSSFVLDAWKKQYSNAPGGDCYKAMPYFWDNHKPDDYSLWYATYNYNSDNKVGFMVSNLVGGFVQRCDEVRKYAFGTMQIIGEEGKAMEIVGCWLMRGQEIKPMLDANPDAEYYTWTKMDITADGVKKQVEDLWCAWETLEGKPIIDCKVFK